jgi:hypothetical protein
VKTYLQRVYEKLGVSGHTAAVVEALRRGLISAPEPPPDQQGVDRSQPSGRVFLIHESA